MRHGQHRVARGQAEGLSRASSLGQLGKEGAATPLLQPRAASRAASETYQCQPRCCCLSEVWQTESPSDVCLVSAQHSTKGLSVLLEGRERTFACDETGRGRVGGKSVLLSCLFRLNILEGNFASDRVSVWD